MKNSIVMLELACIAVGIIIGAMATRYLPVIAIEAIGVVAIVVALLYWLYSGMRRLFRKKQRAFNRQNTRKQATTKKKKALPSRTR